MKKTLLFILLCAATNLWADNARKISADFNKIKNTKSETYFKCIGAGRANEGLRADWQEQLRMIQQDFPYEYIRFHGLLHDDMGVCTRDNADKNKIVYNFQYIDKLYDFLLSIGIKPFVELSFMPEALSSGDKTVFWWKGNVTPPADYEQWSDLINKLVTHLTKRYGAEELETWYFEVWNEPNHGSFFSGKQADYFKLYTVTAETIKKINANYRVGGPATAGSAWVSDFINYCNETQSPVDFITTHAYGVYGALDEFGVMQLQLIKYPDCVAGAVKKSREEMNDLNLSDAELHYTEWSSSYSPRDMTHDTYMNAPYVLNTLRKTDVIAQSMSYWTFTDIFEESGVPTKPFHGGFGLLNMQNLKKPTYFAYKFLYELGDTELQTNDKDCWVCKNENGDIQVLAYNLVMPTYKKYEHNNKIFSQVRIPKQLAPLKIDLSNVPNGKYAIEIYRTGYKKNDVLTAYLEMGSPTQLYPKQEKALHNVSQGKAESIEIVEITDGKFQQTLDMNENDVCFVKLISLK